jgi:hypothetical protein
MKKLTVKQIFQKSKNPKSEVDPKKQKSENNPSFATNKVSNFNLRRSQELFHNLPKR